MGCARCGQQRQAVKDAVKSRDAKRVVTEVARGAKMMAGFIPKDRLPGPGGANKK